MTTKKLGKPYIAFISDQCVMIDLDDITIEKVLKIAERLLDKHKLGGYVVVTSSPTHYHLIFNNPANWKLIIQILFRFRKMSIEAWAKNQAQKGFCALRVNSKNGHKPKIILEKGQTDKAISEYKQILKQFGDE